MEPDEAIDLIQGLPAGSLYKGKLRPNLEWSEETRLLADAVDILAMCLMRLSGNRGRLERVVVRPEQRAAQREETKRARAVRKRLDETEWVAADEGVG